MAPVPSPSRRTPTGRRRGRPPGTTNAVRAARAASLAAAAAAAAAASEPPPKKRRFAPGGLGGGGGRLLGKNEANTPDTTAASTISRSRNAARDILNGQSPSLVPLRERSTRTRSAAVDDEMQWSTAAAVAASVKQADDYKPREERSWEEFHPHLDIEQSFMVLRAEDVDNAPQEAPSTPLVQTPGTPINGSMTPSRHINPRSTGNTPNQQAKAETNPFDLLNGTPTRRSRRPTRDVVSFYGTRPLDLSVLASPRTPKILPLKNQTPKERLDLKQPSYRKTNRIELFESKTFGQARYVDKAMSNVGYQESDHYPRPERQLIKAIEGNADEEFEASRTAKPEDNNHHPRIDRVEYDMDEQDDMWLEQFNAQRKTQELETVTREVFEITMTKIEKEWHALERRIPKPNPKPPQTHRPRSGSAAAVNGEPQAGEEPDSKCAICDDGDCENTNAIVFCDGCNLAVHQECYGVPFIPEGQWLCRKCQLCGRGIPTCLFCPNTDGAFKQTNSSKWAHLLCAMWIPEVSLGNHTFMEPVMDVEKVPKTRWRLNCYICHQKMGACIQCGNKNCYQAFHVTCARRARLFLKMKTNSGQLAVLDGSMVLRAFCDKHCPPHYAAEHNVRQATKSAKKFYRRNMKDRLWADNHTVANIIATQHRIGIPDVASDESQTGGPSNSVAAGDKKKGQPPKNVWRLPSGAPVIPQTVFDVVEASLQRFPFRKRKDYLSEACRYWTLKREARRGAALLKRLQLQMDAFSSMELTRRNFASMGPDGKDRLARRIQFAEKLIQDLEQLKNLADDTVQREQLKLEAAELEEEFVDECYFPVANLLAAAVEKAISLDKEIFEDGLGELERLVKGRYFVTALAFAQKLGDIIQTGIALPPKNPQSKDHRFETADVSPVKNTYTDMRERRRLGKRILKAVQPQLENALRIESEISHKPFSTLQEELEARIEQSLEPKHEPAPSVDDEEEDTIMVDTSGPSEITVRAQKSSHDQEDDADDAAEDQKSEADHTGTNASNADNSNGGASEDVEMGDGAKAEPLANGADASQTPPNSNGYESGSRQTHNGPPTPPQSNGSFGKEPADPLSDGGVLWYLKAFQLQGTSAVDDENSLKTLIDDLTDLDDDEINGLKSVKSDDIETVEATPIAAVESTKESVTPVSKTRAGNSPAKRRTSNRRR